MNRRPLCIAPGCTSRGYHLDGCTDPQCAGCSPRLAADGLNLCRSDRDWLSRNAVRSAALYDELATQLVASGGPGERTSGTPSRGATLNERAADARTTIRAVLASWCRLVAEERGIALPDDTPQAMAAYLERHADWLAAHPAAGEAADELRDLVRMAHPIAYPSGTRTFEVGPCSALHDDCTGTILAVLRRADSLLPSALACDVDPTHTIPADQWLTLGRRLRAKEPAA